MEIFRLFGSIVINDEEAIQSIGNVESQAQSSGNNMMSTFKKLAGVLAGVFAIDKLKDFGLSAVEAAANADAMAAQFDQVFGKIGNDAQKTIDKLGKDFGMVPNRIKPALTQMTSMFKGLGMNTKDAMGTAKDAVTLVADAAAFYDKSFEDANAALNSFIKGNYEGGEAIGLFGNETQLAAWAAKELKVDWKKLNEAGKQTARLEFAKAMQKAAGATGQAARESDSYQNQLGNLQQVWTDLKAKLAQPVLGPVIQGLKNMAAWVGKVDVKKIHNGFMIFSNYVIDVLKPTFDDVRAGLQLLWDKFKDTGGLDTAKSLFEGFKNVLQFVREHAEIVTAALGGLAGAFMTFSIITKINAAIGVFTTLLAALRTGTLMATLAQWGFNTALLANPITWVAVAVGALIAAVILLWKNWDQVSAFLKKSWEWMKQAAISVFNYLANFFKKWGLTILAVLTGPIGALVIFLVKNWDKVKSTAISAFQSVKSKAVSIWNSIKEAIMTPIRTAVNFVREQVAKIKGFFSGLKLKLPHIKLPHFSLSGKFSLMPPSVPKMKVDWYAKGTNFAPGGLAVVGERGPELVNLPRGSKVNTASKTKDMLQSDNAALIKALNRLAKRPISIEINGREFVRATVDDMKDVLDTMQNRKNRMVGEI